MIPTREQCLLLFDRFQLPSQKRIHVEEVAKVATFLAKKLKSKNEKLIINLDLLEAAALLHDIDKNVKKLSGERHPDAAVRILKQLDFPEVAAIVSRHSLHHILDPQTTPTTWEEKLLYLADKMVKYELIGVDHRFNLWRRENLSEQALLELNGAYPKVKALEKEILSVANLSYEQFASDYRK